jgi:hypothetical protein
MQGRFSHEKELRKAAFKLLRASSSFNLGLILALVEHAAKIRLQVAASVAEAVEQLDLDPAAKEQQQQLAQRCVRKLFGGFCSKKTIVSITVVRTSFGRQRHLVLAASLRYTCIHA